MGVAVKADWDRNDFLSVIFRSDYRWLTDRLRFKLGCGHQAEDVASEAFTQFATLSNLETLREPRAMLTTIAQRITYELWRRRDLERAYLEALTHLPQASHPSPEERALLIESLQKIDSALQSLPAKARDAFLYSQIDGLTYAEIAAKLGVSSSMVRQYMTRALTLCYAASGD